jgi:hypothetical protein
LTVSPYLIRLSFVRSPQSAFSHVVLSGGYRGLGRFAAAFDSITAEYPFAAQILRPLVIPKISLCHGESLLQVLRAFR